MFDKKITDLQEYQKNLFYTLLSNRFLIERLSREEIHDIYNFFRIEYKKRKREL